MTNIYLAEDYRDILRQKILDAKFHKNKITVQQLAEETGIQRSYLSRAINKKGDLSEDQLFLVIDKLDLEDAEYLFIDLLHRYQRTGVFKRKNMLKVQIDNLRRENLRADKNLSSTLINDLNSNMHEYFLNPKNLLTHMFLTIPCYADNINLIASQLQISRQEIEGIVKKLEQMGILTIENENKIKLLKNNIFLPKNHVITSAFHDRIRLLAYHKKNAIPSNLKNSVSLAFTCTEQGFYMVKAMFSDLIKDIESLTVKEEKEGSTPTRVVQLELDLFPWNND